MHEITFFNKAFKPTAVHTNAHSVVSHREIGSDSDDLVSAMRASLHQDADVVVVDELGGAEAVALALESAAKGPLVIVVVRSSDSIDASARPARESLSVDRGTQVFTILRSLL